jgi:hypothetical protein
LRNFRRTLSVEEDGDAAAQPAPKGSLMEHQFTHRAATDPRQRESIRFLVRGGLLPPVIDDQFWSRLKFIDQAIRLGLTLGDIRWMLAADQAIPQEANVLSRVERGAF